MSIFEKFSNTSYSQIFPLSACRLADQIMEYLNLVAVKDYSLVWMASSSGSYFK